MLITSALGPRTGGGWIPRPTPKHLDNSANFPGKAHNSIFHVQTPLKVAKSANRASKGGAAAATATPLPQS